MTTFMVANGDDWLQPFDFGYPGDRWRLDDWDIALHVKAPDSDVVLIQATTSDGKLVITDAQERRAELNIGWSEIADTGVGSFEFDFEFVNKVTSIRMHSEIHTLTIRRTITLTGA